MARNLEEAIITHQELSRCCNSRAPTPRHPQVLIYDVPDSPGEKSEVEAAFIDKLRVTNNLPTGHIRVVFRRSGRGSFHHWVLALDPAIFAQLKGSNRLHWGFGSFRFREYCEPQQCFKCYRFGHVRSTCSAPRVLCSRCLGDHPHTDCTKTPVTCRNCHAFNLRNKSAPRLPTAHTAVSTKCTLFVNVRNFLRKCSMPSRPPNFFAWLFFQGNLGRSQAGTQELPNLTFGRYPDVYIVQEPYIPKGKSFGLPLKWRTAKSHTGTVLISVRHPAIAMLVRTITDHVVAVDLSRSGDQITVVAFYFPPSIAQSCLVRELEGVCDSLGATFLLLAGDANVRNSLWGPAVQDHRHHDEGGPLIDFILARNLYIWNDSASLPTFETDRAQSLIDITLSSQSLVPRKGRWEVSRTIISDHNFISFSLTGSAGDTPASGPPRLGYSRLLSLAKEAAEFYAVHAPELHSLTSKASLEAWILGLENSLHTAFSSGTASRVSLPTVPWWDGELESQRKKTRALRARFQRCRNQMERPLPRQLYKREAARYKYLLIKLKSRRCLEIFCSEISRVHPFQLPYKLAAHKIRTATIMQSVQRDDGTFSTSMEETVNTIVARLFPLDHSSSETFEQREVRRIVAEYNSLEMAPPLFPMGNPGSPRTNGASEGSRVGWNNSGYSKGHT
ncbi:hypothetical protein AVEN_186876-1 [Araneus ventricosus]|uniref:Endonuclease/exonuclease/phosphatase domain-containing protein n=1 Tax=Araneus ventricosus TaxID=182803 RepID=A0A4Y2R4J3_ARAVE|nr:hypothetical protein AVEN_186876-1 [Araneus ventricosus]